MKAIFNINIYLSSLIVRNPEIFFLLDVRSSESFVDFLIICTGNSSRQVVSIYKNVREDLKKYNIYPLNFESSNKSNWLVLDYDRVVMHIFQRSYINFYNIEDIWLGSKKYEIKNNYLQLK